MIKVNKKYLIILITLVFNYTNVVSQNEQFVKEFDEKFNKIDSQPFILDGITSFVDKNSEVKINVINTFFKELNSYGQVESLFALEDERFRVYAKHKIDMDEHTIYVMLLEDLYNNTSTYYWISIENDKWDEVNNIPYFYNIQKIAFDSNSEKENKMAFIYNDSNRNFVFEKVVDSFYLSSYPAIYMENQNLKGSIESTFEILSSYNYRIRDDISINFNQEFYDETNDLIPVSLLLNSNEMPLSNRRKELPFITSFSAEVDISSYFIDRVMLMDSSVLYLYVTDYKSEDYLVYKEVNYCVISKDLRWMEYKTISHLTINNDKLTSLKKGRLEYNDHKLCIYKIDNKNTSVKIFESDHW